MMRKSLGILAGTVLILAAAAPVRAGHWRGITGTIASLDAGTTTADITVSVFIDETLTTLETPATFSEFGQYGPAISWGEGEYSTPITLTGLAGGPPATYSGQFSHTYSLGPGPYTITLTSDQSGVSLGESVAEGGPFGGVPHTGGGATVTQSDSYIEYFTDTLLVDFSQVPSLPAAALWLLSGALALGGALLVWRGSL